MDFLFSFFAKHVFEYLRIFRLRLTLSKSFDLLTYHHNEYQIIQLSQVFFPSLPLHDNQLLKNCIIDVLNVILSLVEHHWCTCTINWRVFYCQKCGLSVLSVHTPDLFLTPPQSQVISSKTTSKMLCSNTYIILFVIRVSSRSKLSKTQ